jgi:Protein of unknown function (DUF3800)
MYLMYVDESGDIGVEKSPTNYFVLSALVIHELRWHDALEELINFRRHLRGTKGLKLREEIHASHFINKPGDLVKRIPMYDRVDILKQCANWINDKEYLSVFSVRVDKTKTKYNSKEKVFEDAWTYLIQRFENTINHHNFNGPRNSDERGIIVADNTDAEKLKSIYRKMRRYNPIPNDSTYFSGGNRNIQLKMLIEDPVYKDSRDSYFIQLADVIAYLCFQKYQCNKRAKSKGLHNYYSRLDNVLIKKVSGYNDLGIVEE